MAAQMPSNYDDLPRRREYLHVVPIIHWQKVKIPPISAIIHSPGARQWRIRDNGDTDRARVHWTRWLTY
jgi:hypothetical protein